MQTTATAPTRSQTGLGTLGWIWQAVTGAGLIFLSALHMVAQHFVVEGGLRDYQDVQEYLRNPVILALEVLFLISVTSHALLGVRAILFDFGLKPATEKRISQALTVFGLLAVAYGIWLTWVVIR